MESFIVLFISVFVAGVSSYPSGPPTGACTSLTPGHPDPTNTINPPPYQITVSSAMYAPGDNITVTIEQTAIENEFRGFIIQARRTSGDMDAPVGTFKDIPANTQLLECTYAGSTWAHSAATDKMSVMATWTAPSSDEGTLAFRATVVVQNSGGTSIYYEDIMSEDVAYNGPTQPPGMMTTGYIGTQGMSTDVQDTQATRTDEEGGAGVVRASLLVTLVTMLIMVFVTRRM